MAGNTKVEWLENEQVPRFRYEGQEYIMLNDSIEVVIDGVLYRVKSIYINDPTFMGDVLDALTMEKINRTAA
ncbi:MAG: hypothetical protein LUC38_05370 [Oscillospiraceae bacterium]|nr:hypothetical protein [Ruminococcus sp.]MCD8345376.1 hypothetical protein [Oscillospiraceae bacterium]